MKTFLLFLVFSIAITVCRSQNPTGDERLNLQLDQQKLSVGKQMLQQLNEVKQQLQNMEQKFALLLDEKFLHLESRLQDDKSDLKKDLQKMSELQKVMLNKLDIQCNDTVEEVARDKGFVNTLKRVVDILKSNTTTCDHNSSEVSNISVSEKPQIDSYATPSTVITESCLNCTTDGCFLSDGLDVPDPINHVICDKGSHGSGWIVIQRRMNGFVDFYVDWQQYKEGFWVNKEFWYGLDAIHELTTTLAPVELLVELVEEGTGVKRYAKYNEFAIGGADELYRLKTLGDYEGNAGDALTCHKGYNFSTKDKDNDAVGDHIAVERHGAWWFGNCSESHLNGRYYNETAKTAPLYDGMFWGSLFGDDYSIYASEMLIRSRNVPSK